MDKTSTPSGPVATMADVRRGGDVVFFFSLLTKGSLPQDRVCLVTGIYAAGSGTTPWSLKRGAFGHFFGEFGGVVSPSQQFYHLLDCRPPCHSPHILCSAPYGKWSRGPLFNEQPGGSCQSLLM